MLANACIQSSWRSSARMQRGSSRHSPAWDYEVHDVMHHFLPWLDYEYYEEPDDSSGEIDGHLFSAQLSEAAKWFLVAERFFETPSFPEEENIDEGAGQFRD